MAFLASGAAGLALLDFLNNKGQSFTITDNLLTKITINAVTSVATDCFTSLDTSQVIKIKDYTALSDAQSADLQSACSYCIEQINKVYEARMQLEADANAANPSYTPQVPNPVLQTMMTTGGVEGGTAGKTTSVDSIGPCTAICSDIVLTNAVQQVTLTAQQNCTVKSDISNAIQQSISGQISAAIKNSQDIFGQLDSIFTSNTEAMAVNLATVITQNITNDFVESLAQTIHASQNVAIQGHSIFATNVKQAFNGSMIGNLNVVNSVTDQLRQSAEYSIAQLLLNKNNTIGDLSKDFLGVINTIDDLIEDTTTQILIILGTILAALGVVFGALFLFDKEFSNFVRSSLMTPAEQKLEHARKMHPITGDPEYRARIEELEIDPEYRAKIQAIKRGQNSSKF